MAKLVAKQSAKAHGPRVLKILWFRPCVRGKASGKNEVDRFNIF